MCGIVGFTGRHQAALILLDGLSKLEYRGYDSAGIAVRNDSEDTTVVKAKGKLRALSEKTDDGNVVGVHNGIIENYQELKEKLLKKGYNYSKAADENELHVICCFDCVSA